MIKLRELLEFLGLFFSMTAKIRPAIENDASEIATFYRPFVLDTVPSIEIEPPTPVEIDITKKTLLLPARVLAFSILRNGTMR